MGTSAREDEQGFTLLELVFALLLLSVGVAALFGVLATSFRSTAVDIHRTDATAIAAQGLAELAAAPATGPLPSVTRNGETYTVAGTVTNVTASNGAAAAYPALAVTVSWTDQAGRHTVTQSTAGFTSPPTTGPSCTPPALAAPPAFNAPSSGDPSIDVSWQEPSAGTPVTRWQVRISPNGSAWTTALADEAPLAPAATHQVELGGLAAHDTYAVQVVALSACAPPQVFTATPGSSPTTPSSPSSGCAASSLTLGPAIAERITAGASAGTLAADVTVVVTTPGTCSGGLWAQVRTTGGALVTGLLAASGTYSYIGTLPGLSTKWDLGRHEVQVFSGSTPVAWGELCVEEQGAGSC